MSEEKKPTHHHPLEDVFDIEHNSAPLNFEDRYDRIEPSELIPAPVSAEASEPQIPPDVKDEDDVKTDKRFDEVYDAAMQSFNNMTAYTEIIEPRYAARNAEVALQALGLALQANSAKAKTKVDRKRTNAAFIPFNNGGPRNNNIIADRNELMNLISVDGEIKEIK